jgi:hypothetical protein
MDSETESCLKNIDPKKFRVQNQRILLTYKTWLPKDKMAKFFASKVPGLSHKDIECIVAHETGSTDIPYKHTHIFVNFGKAFNSRSCRVFDYEGIHPNIKPVVTKKWDAVYRYISKEDPDLEQLKHKYANTGSFSGRVWSHSTMKEALINEVKEPGDACGIMAIYSQKEAPKRQTMKPEEHLHKDWQRMLWIKLMQKDKWDYRGLLWVYDAKGGKGKTRFANCWKSCYGACIVTNVAGQTNSATVIKSEIEDGWNQQVIFCDFPYAEQDHKIYASLETFLNGRVTVTKYKGRTMDIIPQDGSPYPKVVVFANWLPNMDGTDRLSEDRYCIWSVQKDGTYVEYENEKRTKRLENEADEKPNAWTLDVLERLAKKDTVTKETLRMEDYLLNVEQEYTFQEKPLEGFDVEAETCRILDTQYEPAKKKRRESKKSDIKERALASGDRGIVRKEFRSRTVKG